MASGTVCIASKTMTKMSTLQAVAPIPAFMGWSMLWLRQGVRSISRFGAARTGQTLQRVEMEPHGGKEVAQVVGLGAKGIT